MQGLAGMSALSPFLPGLLAVASTALRTLSALTHMARWEWSNWSRQRSQSRGVMSTSRMRPKYGSTWFSASLRSLYTLPASNGMPPLVHRYSSHVGK